MSEMLDEEYDFTRINKRLCSKKTLIELKDKYKDKTYMLEKIEEVLKELNNA